jgi:hypothetical protein
VAPWPAACCTRPSFALPRRPSRQMQGGRARCVFLVRKPCFEQILACHSRRVAQAWRYYALQTV